MEFSEFSLTCEVTKMFADFISFDFISHKKK